MRILQLLKFPLWGSGSGTYARNLSETLAENEKHQVAIVAPDKRKPKKVKLYTVKLPFFAAFTGHPEHKKCKLYHELSADELTQIYDAFFQTAINAVKEFKPDIIHVHHASFLTWIAKYIKNVHHINFIVTAHGTGLHNTALNRQMFEKQTTEALLAAKRVTAVSGDTRKWVHDLHGRDFARNMRTIPGGILAKTFAAQRDIKIINKKYNLKNKKIVLFSGKLTPLKGVSYLIKAAKDINGEVIIIGGGSEEESLKKLAKKHDIKNIRFLGYIGKNRRQELLEFYYRADVFVAPSVWDEPLGLVILEAMACSTPVVVTRKGGIPLAVKDRVNGLFVKARNSTDIAEKVNNLLHNENLRTRLGNNARKTVLEKFTWKKIATKFLRIYRASHNGTNSGNGNKKRKH